MAKWIWKDRKRNESPELARNLIQHAMLLVLLSVSFLLPKYGLGGKERAAAGTSIEKGTIVIDAGHGGDDPGMIGESGISEKTLNLIYARKLEKALAQAGYRVVLTRETEDGLYDEGETRKKAQDMQRRVSVIAREAPLLTVSLHQNSYPGDSSVCGPQVFYYEQSQEGARLAACIQNQLNVMKDVPRARKEKGNTSYYILKRSSSVTVIVECGFLTNPEEEQKLQQEDYQEQIVSAVCKGILVYLEGKNSNNPPEQTEVSS